MNLPMATMAAQAYLIASLNLLVASRPEDRQLSPSQIVDLLCRMAQAEDIRSSQEEKRATLIEINERSPYRL